MPDAIAEKRYYFQVTRPPSEDALKPGQQQSYLALLRVSDAVWFANKGYGMQLVKQHDQKKRKK